MPVQGDMIFTLGTNPVAEAIGRAAEPRLGQVLRSHSMPGQKTTHLELLTLASAGTAAVDILTCTWKAEKRMSLLASSPACPSVPAISSTTITYYG